MTLPSGKVKRLPPKYTIFPGFFLLDFSLSSAFLSHPKKVPPAVSHLILHLSKGVLCLLRCIYNADK